jgi:metal-responsive CopG/Arc/MetJ family transcriptional regulator
MPATRKTKTKRSVVRKSISLPYRVASEVDRMAKSEGMSSNRVLIGLIEQGLEARERERERFQVLTQQLIDSKSETERTAIKEELAKMTFG